MCHTVHIWGMFVSVQLCVCICLQATDLETRRWRATHSPVGSACPDGAGCSMAPTSPTEAERMGHSPGPSSETALCSSLTPIALDTHTTQQHISLSLKIVWYDEFFIAYCMRCIFQPCSGESLGHKWCSNMIYSINIHQLEFSYSPLLITIFMTLMAPCLAWTRNCLKSAVARNIIEKEPVMDWVFYFWLTTLHVHNCKELNTGLNVILSALCNPIYSFHTTVLFK